MNLSPVEAIKRGRVCARVARIVQRHLAACQQHAHLVFGAQGVEEAGRAGVQIVLQTLLSIGTLLRRKSFEILILNLALPKIRLKAVGVVDGGA